MESLLKISQSLSITLFACLIVYAVLLFLKHDNLLSELQKIIWLISTGVFVLVSNWSIFSDLSNNVMPAETDIIRGVLISVMGGSIFYMFLVGFNIVAGTYKNHQ